MTRSILATLLVTLASASFAADNAPVDYNRDVRPILSNYCYACHGPDEAKREAGLRLDVEGAARAELESGGFAILPSKSGESKLIARVTTADQAELMPPPETGKKLSPACPNAGPRPIPRAPGCPCTLRRRRSRPLWSRRGSSRD